MKLSINLFLLNQALLLFTEVGIKLSSSSNIVCIPSLTSLITISLYLLKFQLPPVSLMLLSCTKFFNFIKSISCDAW